jgi:tRNA pseudouridine synthase 10
MDDSGGLPCSKRVVARMVERCQAAAARLEFETFLFGVSTPAGARALPKDDLLAWKSEIKRGAGLVLGDAWEPRRADFERPQVILIYDSDQDRVRVEVRSVYLYGRYRKLARGIPQTRTQWSCPVCKGHRPLRDGCEPCQGTGRRFPVSVEDLIGGPCARAFMARKGLKGAKLHGMGREDIDVLCLGEGRPFVLEVRHPKKRSWDLEELAREIMENGEGRVELSGGLHLVGDEVVARIKSWEAAKVYRARCEVLDDAPDLDPEEVRSLPDRLTGVQLEQRTPHRVAHRRSDLVRQRRVLDLIVEDAQPRTFVLQVRAEAGTYIKELISSDEGRTTPSVSGLLGIPCVCAELDVLEICCDDEHVLTDVEL